MVNCLVLSCENKGNIPGIHYFCLTRIRHDSWMRALGKDPTSEPLNDRNVICSKHFFPEDIFKKEDKIYLKPNAVPKLFLQRNDMLKRILQGVENYGDMLQNKNLSTPQQISADIEDNMEMFFVYKGNSSNISIKVPSNPVVEIATGTFNQNDDIKDVKLEDIDIKEQFVDQNEIHDRKTFLERSENESKDFILIKIEEDSSSSSNVSARNPDVEAKEVKLEDMDIEEQFFDGNGRGTLENEIFVKFENGETENKIKNVSMKESDDSDVHENDSDQGRFSEFPSDHNGSSCKDKSSILDDELIKYTVEFHYEGKKYHCRFCQYASHYKCSMTAHIEAVHLKKKKYQCPLCDYGSWYRTRLRVHVESIHMKIRDFKCHLCDYECSTKGTLKLHFESFHLNKKYLCHLCGYATLFKGMLKNHIDSFHLKMKKHQCEFCDYATIKKSRLKRHKESIHLSTKKHHCDLCDYGAEKKWALLKHIKTFHSAKKYCCHLCDYATHYKNDLKNHRVSVHPTMKYQCSFCDYRARYKGILKSHEDSVHWS